MRGGSLTRYHTPSMRGGALANDLVKIAGPSILKSVGHGLQPLRWILATASHGSVWVGTKTWT